MRINKYISRSGIASRRKADEMIEAGRVSVNGAIMDILGYEVKKGDEVKVDGRLIKLEEEQVYLLMNKPEGYITTVSDDRGRDTVMDLLPPLDVRIYPVGRLDFETSGALIFTNDGELANAIMHPSALLLKTYRAECSGAIGIRDKLILEKGVDIGEYITAEAKVEIIKYKKNSTIVEITIHEGKYRQIRRMLKAVGHPVQKLERISFGGINLGHLRKGEVRKLRKEEIETLRGNCHGGVKSGERRI